ncbi:hypothetical protein Tco_0547873 [Tanacetum coccineum]
METKGNDHRRIKGLVDSFPRRARWKPRGTLKSSLEEKEDLLDNNMTTRKLFEKSKMTRKKKEKESALNVVIQITSIVILPNAPKEIKRRLVVVLRAIVKKRRNSRRSGFVSWLMNPMMYTPTLFTIVALL